MRKKKKKDKPEVVYTPVEVIPNVQPDVLFSISFVKPEKIDKPVKGIENKP